MKRFFVFVSVFALFVSSFGCQTAVRPSQEESCVTDGFAVSADARVKFRLPDGWQASAGHNGALLQAVAPDGTTVFAISLVDGSDPLQKAAFVAGEALVQDVTIQERAFHAIVFYDDFACAGVYRAYGSWDEATLLCLSVTAEPDIESVETALSGDDVSLIFDTLSFS